MISLILSIAIFTQSSAGLEFLRIGVGSRPMALGNAYVAYADEPVGIFYNPAGISKIKSSYFSTFYGRWFMDINLGSIAGVLPVGQNGAVGFGVRGLFVGSIERRTEEDPWNYGYYSAYFLNPSFNYAHNINNWGLGIGLNGINSKIGSGTGNTGFVNVGVKYNTDNSDIGLAVSNAGLEVFNTSVPTNIRAGLVIKPHKMLGLAVDIMKPLKDEIAYSVGTEISPVEMLTLRFGYNSDFYTSSFLKKMSFGLGIKTGNFLIDYAAVSCGIFGLTHLFTLSYTIVEPKPVIETLAKEKMMSDTYLRQGIDYYNQEKYDEALNAWDLALIWQPDNQEAINWIAKAQAELKYKNISVFLADGKSKFNSGDYLEAIYNFERALDLDPTLTEAKSLKIEAEKRIKQGISAAVKKKIEDGLKAYKDGNYLNAVQIWNEIMKLEPQNTTVQNYINEANQRMIDEIKSALKTLSTYVSQGNLKKAQDMVKRMLKKYPNQENLTKQKLFIDQKITDRVNKYLKDGRKLYNAQEYIKAEKEFQYVLEYESKNTQALLYLDKIRKHVSTSKKEDAERYYLLGISAYTKNNFKLAIEYWEKVLQLDSKYPNIHKNLERARIKLSELQK
jgi:tetratricopeptide (TPR) repeat protein